MKVDPSAGADVASAATLASNQDVGLAQTMAPGETPASAAHSTGSSGRVDVSPRALESGQRYETGRVLGRGGMGEVRLCKDERIGREVAMKVMRGGSGSAPSGDIAARF